MKDINDILPIKKGDGQDEPLICHLTRQLWSITNYNHPLDPPTYKDFIKNIKQHAEDSDFEWTCKHENGRKCYPKYENQVRNWPTYYDYKESVKIYRDYMNGESEEDLLDLEKTLRNEDIRDLFIIARNILREIKEMSNDPKYEYRRKASMETYKIIMDEIRERLGIKEDNINLNANNTNYNYNTELTEDELIRRTDEYFTLLHESRP